MYYRAMTNTLDRSPARPPSFIELAGHPVRWRLLRELSGSDLRVRELGDRVHAPQNVVSYHLAKLRAARLVTARRSSADGRDAYYSIDLAKCGELIAESGAALHPGLALERPRRVPGAVARPLKVLFVCTGNSARSQMAEALLTHAAGAAVEATSAGSHPKPLHPNTIRVLAAHGIDVSNRQPRHLDEFSAARFDFVITLCDRVREVCPEFPGHPRVMHWSLADPAADGASDDETYAAFEQLAQELEKRIAFLIELLNSTTTDSKGQSHG
jgi:protein-tyrosine-phosphatase/DNA-binding transcriptional ArsR family regulator